MAQAGSSAAINRFLYQILHHLGWLADITLTGRVAGREIRGDANPGTGGYGPEAGRVIPHGQNARLRGH